MAVLRIFPVFHNVKSKSVLCQMLLMLHTGILCCWKVLFPWAFHQLLRKRQMSRGNLPKPESGVTWGHRAPPLMAKAVLSGRDCWACSSPHICHRPWAPTLVPQVLWSWSPDRSTRQRNRLEQPLTSQQIRGGGLLWEKCQGNGALKPDGVECRRQSLSTL